MQTKAFSEFESAFLKIAFGEVFPNLFVIVSLFFVAGKMVLQSWQNGFA
jgi:hypothetical protein